MSRGSGDGGDHPDRDSERDSPEQTQEFLPSPGDIWRWPDPGQLLTTSGERNMRDKYLHSRHPDTEGCVSLHPRHPCVSRPCNLIGRPRPGIYLGSFSYKKYPESIIHHHILPAIITTQGGVYREEKKFNWFDENSILKLSK